MKSIHPPVPAGTLVAVACAAAMLLVVRPAHPQGAPAPAPADADAAVPPTTYRSVLPGSDRAYLREVDRPRLPWKRLFTADGRFVPETALREGADAAPTSTVTTPSPARAEPPAADVPADSDARGVVRAVDAAQGKVKMKHGPIEKLGMPGTTMVFRVSDPALLERVAEGDEVGFTIEMRGSAFYITGFQE